MKRLSVLLIITLFLAGCQLNAAIETDPEPGAPLLTEESLPALTASVPVSETPARTEATAEENDTEPVTAESAASEQATEPPELPHYQYGDTTPTWRPELAENYPADEDCDAALLLEKWLAVEGLTTADLDERGCRQLILASAQPTDGVETITVCYTRNDAGVFLPAEGLDRMYGFLGKKGLCHDRIRDSYTSPAGLWAISSAFGNEQPPDGLKLPWRQVTPNLAGARRPGSARLERRRGASGKLPQAVRLGGCDRIQPSARRDSKPRLRHLPALQRTVHRRLRGTPPCGYVHGIKVAGRGGASLYPDHGRRFGLPGGLRALI